MTDKIEQLHEEIISKDIEDFNNYSETTYTTDNSLEEIKAYECSVITKDIAIKFSLWQQQGDCEWTLNDEDDWYKYPNFDYRINTEQLFNIFIETL